MSESRAPAIARLLRWRAFQEAIAERAYQQASADELRARDAVDQARALVDAVVRRRDELLAESAIDLALLQAISDFERRAWDAANARAETLNEAVRTRESALAAHLDARTRTRVAEARFDQVAAHERDREEKRMFDRMASLIAATHVETKMESRHD